MNIYVFGWKGFYRPLGYFGKEEDIAEIAQNNPKWIFFYA